MFPLNYQNMISNTYYYDKYLYLISKKLGGLYRYYPDYIDMEYDDNKKTTKKRLFRRSCNNYDLNSDFLLCFKYKNKYEKGKSKTIDRHKLKKLKNMN